MTLVLPQPATLRLTSGQHPQAFGTFLMGRPAAAAGLVFIAVAAVLSFFHGNRLIFSPDEGIILEEAQRMLAGNRLYVDFYGNMSPGSYWLQEFAFRCLGLTLRAGRLIVSLDFALQCAIVFWLIARAGYWKAAGAAAAILFCFEAGNPTLLLPGHRWDSAALSLLSVALCVHGAVRGGRATWCAAGALIVFAAFCTPSIAILAPITVLALLLSGRWRDLLPYLGGAAATTVLILAIMQRGGYLAGFAEQMLWLRRNYSGVNTTPYGWPLGGYGNLLHAIYTAPFPLWPLLLMLALWPAVLPVIAVAGWMAVWVARKGTGLAGASRFTIPYLLACTAGYIGSTEPRPDLTHLTIISPLAWVLITFLITEQVPAAGRQAIFGVVFVGGLLYAGPSVGEIRSAEKVPTPVGVLRASPQDAGTLRNLLAEVRPGQSLYVHPYLPLFYFLTQTGNPTRYSYLAPGMMGAAEENSARKDLERSPPDWILYLQVRREDYLKVFPSAAGASLHYPRIEDWIGANYAPLEHPLWISGYQLLTRRRPAVPELSADSVEH